MKRLLYALCFSLSLFGYSQTCDCTANFNWAKKTFEDNDAGFQYALDRKGQNAYDSHNQLFKNKVKTIDNAIDCSALILEWLRFFRSGHIAVRPVTNVSAQGTPLTDAEIIETYKNAEQYPLNLEEFQSYVNSKSEADFEGIWLSEPYKIGVKKVHEDYLGVIIEADGVYWRKGQIKFKIHADGSATYYMRDHSKQTFEMAELLGDNHLQMGFVNLKRMGTKFESNSKIERYFKSIDANTPFFEQLDTNTTYLRIPSFNGSWKPVIDSLIQQHKTVITKTPNLIIDLRNNGGGSDRSYSELLPILYTNPIRTVGVELLSTPLNNQRMQDFITNPDYGFSNDEKEWAQNAYDKLSKHLGEFVNLNEHSVSLNTFDKVHAYPKNVGVIINENNGSTTEQFLLAAKQSKKVKLYGTTTAGVLDISNMYFVKSPSKDIELGYCLSKSMRIPHMSIDDKGIQPDFYISKDIPKYEWIDFVIDSFKH
jgi:hypothetical protein